MNTTPILSPYFYEQLPARIKTLNDLANENLVWGTFLPSLNAISYPATLRRIVGEIASAKAIGFDLALIPYLASLAIANRGYYAVRTQDGSLHPLSFLFVVGADAASGKSRAAEEELHILEEWQLMREEEIKKENQEILLSNEILDAQATRAKKIYAKTLDEEALAIFYEARRRMQPRKNAPKILMNDVTSAALSVAIANQGYISRLESDGVLFPKDAYRQVTKYWAGESHRQSRISRDDSFAKSPIIVDLLMTQTAFFQEYVCNANAISSGLMSRTLCYHYKNISTPTATYEVDGATRDMLERKILSLLDISDKRGVHSEIRLDYEAEYILAQNTKCWSSDAQEGGSKNKIKDFANRMGQHAIRLAGLLCLSENEAGDPLNIDRRIMECAISMTEVFAQHAMRTRIVSFEDINRACLKAVFEYILKANYNIFQETFITQKFRNRFSATEVKIALYLLETLHYVEQVNDYFSNQRSKGRPLGRKFRNMLYDPNGAPFI